MRERNKNGSGRNQAGRRSGRGRSGSPSFDSHADLDAPYWIYGLHAALAAIGNPKRSLKRLVATPNAARNLPADTAFEEMTPRDIDKLLPPDSVHQGIAVLADPLDQPYLDDILNSPDARPIVFLDQVTDPHNVGAILRSAAALGASAVATSRRNSAPVSGVLAKSASGALEHVPYLQFGNLADMLGRAGDAGYVRLGLDERGETFLGEAIATGQPLAFVFGAEGAGLRQRTRETCDALVRLPTEGAVQALNVSNAAAIALYHARILRD